MFLGLPADSPIKKAITPLIENLQKTDFYRDGSDMDVSLVCKDSECRKAFYQFLDGAHGEIASLSKIEFPLDYLDALPGEVRKIRDLWFTDEVMVIILLRLKLLLWQHDKSVVAHL